MKIAVSKLMSSGAMPALACVLLCLFLAYPLEAKASSSDANHSEANVIATSDANASTKDLTIQRIIPAGDEVDPTSGAARQIVIQFNRPVVPIGQMSRNASELPITFSHDLGCEWRWLNTSALACQIAENVLLAPSTTYSLSIKPGITAEDGETIAQTYAHQFTTQRPDITYAFVRVWESPERPVLRVAFNQPVTQSSVEAHVYYGDNEPGTRIAVTAKPDKELRNPTPFWVAIEQSIVGLFTPAQPEAEDTDLVMVNGEEARRVWLLTPADELEGSHGYMLRLEPGIASAYGPELSHVTRDVRTLETLPEFAFKGVSCTDNDGNPLLFEPYKAPPPRACNPLGSINLVFTSPVFRPQLAHTLKFEPRLAGDKESNFWGDPEDDYSQRFGEYEKGREYSTWLPTTLKAAKTYQIHEQNNGFFARLWNQIQGWFGDTPPTQLTDEFGRTLQKPISISFATDHRKPNYELPYDAAVLEQQVDSEIPLWVNNLENFTFDYNALDTQGARTKQTLTQSLPFVQDLQFAVPLGLRSMLNGRSGAVYGVLSTSPSVTDSGGNVRTSPLFAQVTPYAMHVKLGHFQSLIWVTDFATGLPVEGVDVSAYVDTLTELKGPVAAIAKQKTNMQGIALLPGTDTLDADLLRSRGWQDKSEPRLFFAARKGDMQAILPIIYDFEINTYRAAGEDFSTDKRTKYGHMRSWGMTAQGVYRSGDTIDYKLYVRQDNGKQLIAPPKGVYNKSITDPTTGKEIPLKGTYSLTINDPTGKVVEEIPSVTLNAFGAYDGHFTLPANAAVGWYEFYLTARFENDSEGNPLTFTAQPLSVLVADFTPSPFRVTNTLNADQLVPDQTLEVSTQAQMHAGGPYADAALRVTAILDAKDFTTKENSLNQFIFDSGNDEYSRSEQVFQSVVAVDAKGENLISFAISPERMTNKIAYGALTVESAVQDERGKYVTTSSQLNYSGVDRLVGLYSPDWVLQSGKPASIDVITVGVDGKAVADTPARVTIEKLERKAARVKGAGNAYLATFETEWKPFGTCTITASATPQPCRFTPDAAGSYRAVAQIEDQKNRPHTTTLALWATGGDYVLWDDGNSNSLELVKQSDGLKVGDTARYLVKNPFPGAQALVTVERYGVIDSFTQTLEGSTPIIEIPIKPDYVPGFYVSVTVMAPRAGDKPFGKPGELDLGKPAFRMGYAATEVKDPYKEMRITAKADREVYRPGDTVTLSLHAEPSRAGTKEPIELAVVVLDESVFDLIQGGRNYFDPYKGFYLLDALDLRNFNLITQLIGRQKFEKKGSNAGGDGGAGEAMRSMFKYVSYWNPSLVVDAQGNASAQFKVPDNLTGWRILTLATTPTDRMGLGEGTFKVNRPTELRPVMPNQVMEGDQFKAGFSVMNRTDKARDIEVRLEAEGILSKAGGISKTIHLEPFKREIVWLPLTAGKLPNEIRPKEAMIDFKASAGDATDRDALDYHLNVKKWRSLETAANYGSTTDNHVSESIAFPAAMKPDVGSLSVELSPSVIGNISGAFNYIRDYPYLCWEQRLTKAIAASQFTALHSYLPTDSKWQDSEKIPVQTLTDASSFQAPNGGMAYFLANDDYVDPYLSAYTALGFQWLKEMGHTIPDTVEQSLNAYLQRFLKQDVAPTYYDPGMASTVRAVALAALAEQKKVTLSDLRRYTPHVKQMSLFGQAHYVQAALSLGAPEEEVRPVIDQILSHANQSGGKVTFTETLDDSYVRLLSSPLRENCVILDTLSQYAKTEQGAKQVSDIPLRLVRSITQARGTRDHWENTQENLFCMQALWHYSQTYEAEKPAMKVNASLGTQALGTAAFDDVRDASVTLSHAIDAQDVGRKAQLELSREGDGRLYYATRLQFAPTGDANQPANAGIEVKREYSVEREGIWQKMAAPYTIKRGELVLVDLYISLPAARTFVVVDDPVPGGLEPVNRDLATSSVVDAQKGEYKRSDASWYFHFNDWVNYQDSRWSFYHQELRHDAVRFYADYLPAGHYHLSYTAQAIAEGEFSLLPMKAEEMYDTDIFGKTSAETLKVEGAN